jgi:hypothetical protein
MTSPLTDRVIVARLLMIQRQLARIQEYYKGKREDVNFEIAQARVHLGEAIKLLEKGPGPQP